MDNSIGLHIYAIHKYKTRKHKVIPFDTTGDGARLKKFMPHFLERYKSAEYEEGEAPRPWYLVPDIDTGDTYDGLVMYGSSGYATDIVDRETRTTQYRRKVSDIEIIPLYYRIWVPDSGNYALIGFQTFGQRSCVGRVQIAMESGFRHSNSGYRITFTPVAPSQITSYKTAEVKRLYLTKHDYSSDPADNQLVEEGEIVDLSVSFSAKRRSNLGILDSFTKRIASSAQSKVLRYNDTEFDEAAADVMVGGKRRKVTLVGISRNTGKFDLSEDVSRGVNGMPRLASIRQEVEKIFNDIVAG
ncbi:hypothetical protein [Mameliella sediminis]|uniref:hypothetical protein n=1 Tax=Mameliella sediminis TaxID=2836866 RepID=UPI001C48DA06|nr:hypothetical protein [Mameliella sediminis]MBV7394653.1 hypothetical protein [Mameliella sediminis]